MFEEGPSSSLASAASPKTALRFHFPGSAKEQPRLLKKSPG